MKQKNDWSNKMENCTKSVNNIETAKSYSECLESLAKDYEYEDLSDGTYAIIHPKDPLKTKYVIPEGVSIIRSMAFDGSNAEIVEEIVLPSSIRIIEDYAFYGHKTLRKINFPDGLEEIGDYALKESQIDEVVFPNSIKRLGEHVLEGCRLGKVVLPESIAELPFSFFRDSTIGKITIPSNIIRIDSSAFSTAKIEEINFKEGLKGISDIAFYDAELPKQISLPSTLLTIHGSAFMRSHGLEKIIYDGNLSISVDESVEVITSKEEKESIEREKKEREDREKRGVVVWDGVTDSRKCTTKTVGYVTFYIINEGMIVGWESKSNIDKLEIPDGCSRIDAGCFKSKKIKSIVYPRDKTTIEISFAGGLANFIDSGVTQLVIPKEAEKVIVDDRLGRISIDCGIKEIKFEDPTWWDVKKEIIDDSMEMIKYIYRQKRIFVKSLIKIFLKKLFGG